VGTPDAGRDRLVAGVATHPAQASGEKVDEIAGLLAHGHPLPPGHEVSQRPGT
jgi:hypothetical protein